ncbi:MAG: potassium channel family protein [Gaiellaceae bacterium]
MKAIIIGCGRTGSSVAHRLADVGWDVGVVDEDEESLANLGPRWSGGFIVGHGMDREVLVEAGIETAEAVVVSTDGDNTNIVIGLIAQKRYRVQCVVVRILDPARAAFFAERGLRTVCPTSAAIDTLTEAVRTCELQDEAAV